MNRAEYNHPKISLCRQCGGKGFLSEYDELNDVERTEVCPSCEGSGRIVESSVMITTTEPYNPKQPNLALYGKTSTNDLAGILP